MVGTMLGLGTLAFSGASASAAAMLPLSSVASGEANTVNDGVIQVNHKNGYKMKWHKKHFGDRCFYRYDGCRHFYRYRYHTPYLTFPLFFGAYNYYDYDYYDYDYGYAGLSSAHIRWCLNRYRSYNPRTNLWVSYSGKKHQCDGPYY
jgi:hypothetical protein